MIKVTLKGELKFPDMNFQEELGYVAEKICIPLMQQDIYNNVAIDGKPFPKLEDSTLRKKNHALVDRKIRTAKSLSKDKYVNIAGYGKTLSEKGKSFGEVGQVLSGMNVSTLIDTGKLISSFRSKDHGKNKVMIYISGIRSKIAVYLQEEGIRSKVGTKFFYFFGINQQMHDNGIAYMKTRIKDILQNGRTN